MDPFEKICIDMIEKIESIILLDKYDHDEKILAYLEEKREYVEACRSVSKGVGKYLDTLEKELK